MAFEVVVTKNAQKNLKKLSPQIQKRIKQKLLFFIDQPNPLDLASPLNGSKGGQYRWRVGVYRIIFDVDRDTIVILRIQHRREVYRK